MTVGIFTMCSLAIIRFIGLVLPFRFRNSFLDASSKKARTIMVTLLWILGAILASPNLIYFRIAVFAGEISALFH